MAFKVLYHEDALADLEEIFEWSREKHPETTEQFADDLFDHIELLQALPYIGTPIKGHPQLRRLLHSPLYVYYRLDEHRAQFQKRTPILKSNAARSGRGPPWSLETGLGNPGQRPLPA